MSLNKVVGCSARTVLQGVSVVLDATGAFVVQASSLTAFKGMLGEANRHVCVPSSSRISAVVQSIAPTFEFKLQWIEYKANKN